MSDKRQKASKVAVLFNEKCVTRLGFIDDFLFACEVKGANRLAYSKARKLKYHLTIMILDGTFRMLVNGEERVFGKHTYINLPVWCDIYSIEHGEDFHALVTASNRTVLEDIFRNRNPFPPDFRFRMDHGLGGDRMEEKYVERLTRDIYALLDSLNEKDNIFAEERSYSYYYILLTDMADIMWKRYGKGSPSRHPDMRRSESIMKGFIELLMKYVIEETEVAFYAEKLCISKQYLSLIVKEKTHVPIGTVIASMRIETATQLLRDPSLTIQQVAARMAFADQSSFGKFFKRHTGISPLKYRQNLRKTLLTLRAPASGF